MDLFKDKIVIITGGASGIGRALGKELANRGSILVLADLNGPLLLETVADIRKSGNTAESIIIDVSKFDEVKKLIDETVRKHGRIDYLFNNAGIVIIGEARDVQYEDWQKVIDVNLYGVVNGVVAAYPIMVEQGYGHIVNTASGAGLIPASGEISYTTSKYGVVGLSNALRIEGADLGVKVSVVCPGFIDTPILENPKTIKLDYQKISELYPSKMLPENCAKIILKGVHKNKAIIIVTIAAKILWLLQRLSPALVRWIVKRSIREMREMRIED